MSNPTEMFRERHLALLREAEKTRTTSHFFLRPLGLLVLAALVVSVMAVVLASPAHASTYTVTNTNDSGAGSLREAINNANASPYEADTIGFSPSLSGRTITLASQLPTIQPTQVPADSPGLTIDGGSANITISGNNQVRVLEVGISARLTLNKLTVTNGKASGFPDGGGIYNHGGILKVINSTVSGNSASGNGGGIGNVGTLTVINSTLSGNGASNGGGGIWNSASGATATVINSTLSDNRANFGGGIWNSDYAYLTVSSSTLSGNSAAFGGGGIFNITEATGTLQNTIVANSTSGGDCGGNIDGWGDGGYIGDDGYNLDSDASCAFGGTSRSDVDPKLGSLAANGGPTKTHALLAGSPAINAIPRATNGCGTTFATDQRGVSRPQGGACDIGSFELDQPPTVTINQASSQADPTTSGPISFTALFNEPVSGFTASDVTLSGTAGATTAVVSGGSTTFTIAVSGMSADGTVIASIPANAAQDTALKGNSASTSTDNTVTFVVNGPPTAVADSYTINEDTPLDVAAPGVLSNDTDQDGDTLRAVLVSGPAHGTLTLNADGSFTYTPNKDYYGTDSFTYRASDDTLASNTATVGITVKDATAPTVKTVVPQENATGIGPGANISATFSEAMRATSVKNAFELYEKGSTTAIAATVSYDAATKRAVLNPSANLERGATYKAVVTSGARDLSGNALDQNSSVTGNQNRVWSFTVRR